MTSRIRLRIDMLAKYCRMTDGLWFEQKGRKEIAQGALASRLGVAESTVYRVVMGRQAPGEIFIANLLRVFPDLDFNDLFEVVTEAVPA